jgi:integrase
MDTHDLAVFMVLTMVRVGEALKLRFGDCVERMNAAKQPILVAHVTGKRGTRTIVAPAEALAIINRRRTEDTHLVFSQHHRDAFRELLIAAGLYRDSQGFTRNYKSLRATSISFKLLDDPSPNFLSNRPERRDFGVHD